MKLKYLQQDNVQSKQRIFLAPEKVSTKKEKSVNILTTTEFIYTIDIHFLKYVSHQIIARVHEYQYAHMMHVRSLIWQ